MKWRLASGNLYGKNVLLKFKSKVCRMVVRPSFLQNGNKKFFSFLCKVRENNFFKIKKITFFKK